MRPLIRVVAPILLLLAVSVASHALLRGTAARADQAPTLADAFALIQAQDFDSAAVVLEGIIARQPGNARAWTLLGFARQSAGDVDGALAAHLKAATFEATAPQGMYNAGLAYALKGERDSAFAWLERARDTGRMDMTGLDIDDDAKSLRDDPRYRALMPSADAFAHPFVENVAIIREWDGEHMGDQFGWIARNIGDVDGDGVNDVTTSAPTWGEKDNVAPGKIYVYSTGTGKLLWAVAGRDSEQLGLGIEAAGDVNGDGIPDVAAGGPVMSRAYVYSGRDGKLLLSLEGEAPGDMFGRRVADVGDVNGDGHGDVLVGAPQNDAAGADAGAAYIYSGKDGTRLIRWTGERAGDKFGSAGAGWTSDGRTMIVVGAPGAGERHGGRTYIYRGLEEKPAFVIDADSSGVQLGGMFVSVVGDVDADGTPDVYASDWPNGAKGRATGRIYVHSGATGKRLITLTGEAAGDGFGIGPADAGDVDGDGHADLVIGAWRQGTAAPAGGKIYVYSGKDGSLLATCTGKVMGETLGFDATGMGDVDGDGTPDYLVTSAWSAIHGARTGRMYVISGKIRAQGG